MTWWITISKGGRCGGCGEPIPPGQEFAYQHEDRQARCIVCVGTEALVTSVSKRAKQARAGGRPERRLVPERRSYDEVVLKQLEAAGAGGVRFRSFTGVPTESELMSTLASLRSRDLVVYRSKVGKRSPSRWIHAQHAGPLAALEELHLL